MPLKNKKNLLSNKISVFCESYDIEEHDSSTSKGISGESQKQVLLKGKALVFGKPTRNKVMYTLESAKATLSTWIGRPFLNSHDDSNVLNSIGHITKMEIVKDESNKDVMTYEVDIDPAEVDFIRKAKRKDIPHVSIQVLVSDVRRKESAGFGDYIEADIKEGLELSAVLIPGDWESNGVISESKLVERFLGGNMREELNDIIEAKKDKEDEEKMKNPNYKGGVPPASYEEAYTPCPKCGNQVFYNKGEKGWNHCDKCGAEVYPPESKEDLSTSNGAALIQVPALPSKKTVKTEPTNKVTPDTVPPTMISKSSESIDDVMKKKTNESDETQEENEAEFTYGGDTIPYNKKGGNNIPAPYPTGFKAESLSVWKHCKRPMIVGRNSFGKTTMFCKACGKNITTNEGLWCETYKNLNTKYEFLKMSKILTRRRL